MSVPQLNAAGSSPQRGDRIWHLGVLMKFHVTGNDTGGRFWISENWAPKGHGPPTHRHGREDELLVMLDGRLSVSVGGSVRELESGDLAFAPRTVDHAFKIRSTTARYLVLAAPAGFENWFLQTGQAATDDTLPPPDVMSGILQIVESPSFATSLLEYGVEVLGPPMA